MDETADELAALRAIIDRSAQTAGPAIAKNFIGGGWRMSAEELVAFWGEKRTASVATVSPDGRVHAAPLDVALRHGRFYAPTFGDSVRLRDHEANPRCVITTWEGEGYVAAIVYGDATVPRSAAYDAAPGALRAVEITPTRIYAIRPPAGRR